MKKKIKGKVGAYTLKPTVHVDIDDLVPPRMTKATVFARSFESPEELPEKFVYNGHPDDALFEFVFRVLGYTVTNVESDGKTVIEGALS